MNTEDQVKIYEVADVFSTGETPAVTYTKRIFNTKTGATYDDYLSNRKKHRNGGVLVCGLSKLGKTSLVERCISSEEGIWLDGTIIKNLEGFWRSLAYRLGIFSTYTDALGTKNTDQDTFSATAGPRCANATWADSETKEKSQENTQTFDISIEDAVIERLKTLRTPIVFDDYHHLEPTLRDHITEALKPIIRRSFLVLIAIPSHAFDPQSAATDLGGRVKTLEISPWKVCELQGIAESGFQKLGVEASSQVVKNMSQAAFGSPHVMQEICLSLMEYEGIHETTLSHKIDDVYMLDRVVSDVSNQIEPSVFRHLLKGPEGKPRDPITTTKGITTDIYGLILLALRESIPPMAINERDIRSCAAKLSTISITTNRITSALGYLAEIAITKQGDSDPVFTYNEEERIAYIDDSILGFFLKYGDWTARAEKYRKSN
ncbi:hypothetical protein [Corynebacterium variabile]|uniref:Uncharacterized protein n=1 Tax=Corynebacterium variabile TaxID=1727 RepID=A0A0X2NPF2_9CORY|nr:hypothetical protein [Corynebacterium variabile]CUU67362.1 hypothetical protein CVAR292_02724 [Corynebacterium variabile]